MSEVMGKDKEYLNLMREQNFLSPNVKKTSIYSQVLCVNRSFNKYNFN